jgi:hypothetical protein
MAVDKAYTVKSVRTTVVHARSSRPAPRVVRSTAPETIESTEDPGDLTLLFDNKLI